MQLTWEYRSIRRKKTYLSATSLFHTQIPNKLVLNRAPGLRGERPEANDLAAESYDHEALFKKTPWSRILLEKLIVNQTIKKFSAQCIKRMVSHSFREGGHYANNGHFDMS